MIIEKNIRKFFDDWGENYHFNICMRMLMESLNEDERFDYPFFSGLTNDVFTQIYTGDSFVGPLSHTKFDSRLADRVFSAIGYNHIFVSEKDFQANKSRWYEKVVESLNNGKMVILRGIVDFGLICGYEQNNILHIYGRRDDKYLTSIEGLDSATLLIFIGDKVKTPDIKKIYANMVMQIPSCFNRLPENRYYFGINALEKWHDTLLDDSLYDNNNFDFWNVHASPLTIESENNGCNWSKGFARELLKRFSESLNGTEYQDLIKNLIMIYDKLGTESSSIFHEKLDHGINTEDFRQREVRKIIAEKIRSISEYHKEILLLYGGSR
ncbi:MAG: hypothetical protein FWF92_07855 [Oscillospiraceae bacterium]|nr:hypothetical protein [Oscillospiraceae bacterium]